MLQMGAPEQSVKIVLNRCKAEHIQLSPGDVESHFGKPAFAMIPNDYRRVQSSLDLGHGIMADAPKSPSRLAIHELARKIAGDQLPQDDPAGQSQGLLDRLWRRKPQGSGTFASHQRA